MLISYFFSSHYADIVTPFSDSSTETVTAHTHLTAYPHLLSCQPTRGIAEFTWNVKGGEGIEE
jgi:hypothetical protein